MSPCLLDLRHAACTPEQGTHARQELARIEGFCQIIVCTDFEPDNAIDRVSFGGEHEDRRVVMLAQPAADREPVFTRQHEIKQDEVGTAAGEDFVEPASGLNRLNREAFLRHTPTN